MSLLQLLCSFAVTTLGGLTVGKMNMGRNIAIGVLGAAVAALTAVSKVCDYDGKASINAEAAKFYIKGKNTASGYLKSHQLMPRLPDVLVENCTTVNLFVQPTQEPGSTYPDPCGQTRLNQCTLHA